jgi:hypothetical protein
MELFVMLTGILIGAAAASLVAFGWAASQLRWLSAQSNQQIAYWRDEAKRATTAAARLRDQHAAGRPGPRPRPRPRPRSGDGA